MSEQEFTVRVGQVWEDCDKRSCGRRIRVIRILNIHIGSRPATGSGVPHAEVELVNYRGRPASWLSASELPRAKPGRRTMIRLDRFVPTSSGYRLVEDAPEEGELTDVERNRTGS